MKRILSIDGGGIRGVIPTYILMKLEELIQDKISNHFNLIAGTSTGGIIAAGLGTNYSAEDLLNLYLIEGPKIFQHTFRQKIRSVYGLKGSKYPDKNIERVLNQYFDGIKLSDLTTDFLCTAYNMTEDRPRFFSSDQEGDLLIEDVLRATSAAPTFFNPKTIDGKDYVDGGVVSNNPAMCAYAEAKSLYKTQAEDMFILSLGTGTTLDSYRDIRKWFKLKWISPLIEIMTGADSGVVHYQLVQIYNSINMRDNYWRINSSLPVGFDGAMDNASEEGLSQLLQIAESLYCKNKKKLEKIAKIIT